MQFLKRLNQPARSQLVKDLHWLTSNKLIANILSCLFFQNRTGQNPTFYLDILVARKSFRNETEITSFCLCLGDRLILLFWQYNFTIASVHRVDHSQSFFFIAIEPWKPLSSKIHFKKKKRNWNLIKSAQLRQTREKILCLISVKYEFQLLACSFMCEFLFGLFGAMNDGWPANAMWNITYVTDAKCCKLICFFFISLSVREIW